MARPSSRAASCWASWRDDWPRPLDEMSEAIPAYSSRGQGEPAVFLLHGIGGGKAYWEPQLDGPGTCRLPCGRVGHARLRSRARWWSRTRLRNWPARSSVLIDRVAPSGRCCWGTAWAAWWRWRLWRCFRSKIAGLILSCTSPGLRQTRRRMAAGIPAAAARPARRRAQHGRRCAEPGARHGSARCRSGRGASARSASWVPSRLLPIARPCMR